MKNNLDITKPRYNEQIWSVPWPFVKSRFHCNLIEGQPCHRGLVLSSGDWRERKRKRAIFLLPIVPRALSIFLMYCYFYWDTQPEHLQGREISQWIRVPLIAHEFRLRPDAGRNVRLFDHNVFVKSKIDLTLSLLTQLCNAYKFLGAFFYSLKDLPG